MATWSVLSRGRRQGGRTNSERLRPGQVEGDGVEEVSGDRRSPTIRVDGEEDVRGRTVLWRKCTPDTSRMVATALLRDYEGMEAMR